MDNLADIFNSTSGELGLMEFFISILFSLVAGVICMFLYRVYFHSTFDRNESLTRSFVLIAPSISAVFWAIQYSLPLSLGLLGALSFVRFRTPIKKPEDIGFILLIIALSLLSSVFRFQAAGILLGLVVVVVFTKSFLIEKNMPFLSMGAFLTAFISTGAGDDDVGALDKKVRETLLSSITGLKGSNLTLNDVVQKESGYSLRYSIYMKRVGEDTIPAAITALKSLDNLDRVEVFNGRVA